MVALATWAVVGSGTCAVALPPAVPAAVLAAGWLPGGVEAPQAYLPDVPQGDLDERPGERRAAEASTQATVLGREVEVWSRRTATERVFAQPSGEWSVETRAGDAVGTDVVERRLYNAAPTVEQAPRVSSTDMSDGVVVESRPGFSVDVADPEKGLVHAEFEIRRDGVRVTSGVSEQITAGGRAAWSLADEEGLFLPDGAYTIRARAADGHAVSSWSPKTAFVVDAPMPRPHAPWASPLDEVWFDDGVEIRAVDGEEVHLSVRVDSGSGEPVRAVFRLEQTDEVSPDVVRLGSVVASGERSVVTIDMADLANGYYLVRVHSVAGDLAADAAVDVAGGGGAGAAGNGSSAVTEVWLRTLTGTADLLEFDSLEEEEAYEDAIDAELEALDEQPTEYPGVDALRLEDLQEIADDEGRDVADVVDEALWEDRYYELAMELSEEYPQISQWLGGDRRGKTGIWFAGEVPDGVAARVAAVGGGVRVVGGAALSERDAEQVREFLWSDAIAWEGGIETDFDVDPVTGEVTGTLGVPQGHRLSYAEVAADIAGALRDGLPADFEVSLAIRPMSVTEFNSSPLPLLSGFPDVSDDHDGLLPPSTQQSTGVGTFLPAPLPSVLPQPAGDVLPLTGL